MIANTPPKWYRYEESELGHAIPWWARLEMIRSYVSDCKRDSKYVHPSMDKHTIKYGPWL